VSGSKFVVKLKNKPKSKNKAGKLSTTQLLRQLPRQYEDVEIRDAVVGDLVAIEGVKVAGFDSTRNVVEGATIENVKSIEVISKAVPKKKGADEKYDPLRWPQSPPIIDLMENFDEPDWFDTMVFMVDHGKHIALEGPPGVGKDTAVQQLAALKGVSLVTVGGDAGFRRRDLVGTTHISNGTSFFEVGEYAAAAINGWWVLLTEVNAADADALMYINAQLAPPYVVTMQGKAYPVHDDFRIFVSYNHGLIGTKPLPQSFKDRFFSIKVPFFTESQLKRRLLSMGMRKLSSTDYPNSAIVQYGVKMWDAHERGHMRYQITTRRLADALLLINVLDMAPDEAIRVAVISAIDSPVESRAAKKVLEEVMRRLPKPTRLTDRDIEAGLEVVGADIDSLIVARKVLDGITPGDN